MKFILAIDQGTTSSRAILYDGNANPIAMAQQEFTQLYPHEGWVEHDPEEIWGSQLAVCKTVMAQLQLQAKDIEAIGITNQRETTVVWERATGKPIYNAIVWQDRRTADHCSRLQEAGMEAIITEKTGLLIDAYFSATKICWILDNVAGARKRAEQGELVFGTIDTWLVWKLTDGELYITDVSNAARTLLYNIDQLQWDEELLSLFNIPACMLPDVKPSSACYGETRHEKLGAGIPITAIAGDQQAALFGQLCFKPWMAKCTYGTGSFLMMNTGPKRVASSNKLLTTIAWQMNDEVIYALEGSVFIGGAVIQWLRDGLQLIIHAADSEVLAAEVDDNGGVVFVPALTGLGAPHWDAHARGAIFGITRGTTKAHIIRAALESICFQVNDVLQTMAADTGESIVELRVDGGAAANNLLLQMQADISAINVVRPITLETTALGAAYLAGIGVGLWTIEELNEKWSLAREFQRQLPLSKTKEMQQQWLKAVARAKHWIE
jgi:glycerol kinase